MNELLGLERVDPGPLSATPAHVINARPCAGSFPTNLDLQEGGASVVPNNASASTPSVMRCARGITSDLNTASVSPL